MGLRARRLLLPFVAARMLRLQLGFALVELTLQCGEPVADALAVFAHVLELLLHARKFRIGFVEAALRGMHGVARGVMAVAQFLNAALGFAQARGFGFEFDAEFFDFTRIAFARAGRLAPLLQPQEVLREAQLFLQAVILAGHFSLLAQMFKLLLELDSDVLDAQQVLARVAQSQFGLAPAFAVFRDARRFFEEHAQFFGLRFDDARNHALFDDRIGARAESRAEEDISDVAPPHVQVVDVVRRFAVALEHALDRNFAVARPLAARAPQAVVEHELDACPVHGLAVARTVEQNVLHGLAAQMLRRRFAEHPAHGIDDIGFSAAVRANHAD